MSIPTTDEKVAIEKFRAKVGDVLKPEQLSDDWFLIRWLRARELNLDKAEQMLRASMKWRSDNKVDSTLDLPADAYFATNYPFDLSGKDKDGRPLLILPLGKWDARMAVEDGKVEQLVGYINFFFESVTKAIRNSSSGKPGHPHTQFTCIVDWDGYSFKQFTNIKAAQTVLKMSSVYEAHYPEILHHAFFINSTAVFQMLFALMKKILAERTVGKIQVYGTNQKEWEPEILKMVDASEIHYELREGKSQNISDDEIKNHEHIKNLVID